MLYRLSWDMPSAVDVDRIEATQGADVWPHYDFNALSWHRVSTISEAPFAQYRTLREWARVHTQPIRNVVLEQTRREPEWFLVEPADARSQPASDLQ